MIWEKWVKYPTSLRYNEQVSAEILDSLEELNPPNDDNRDCYVALSDWLRQNVKFGLISQTEMYNLQGAIAPMI